MNTSFDASYLIPGTDAETLAWYQGLAERAQDDFELFEDEYVIVDTETTGLDFANDRLIEIAACIIRGPEVIDRFQTFVNPGRKITSEISELTHIKNEDVKNAPDPSLAVELFAEFADDRSLIAHNAAFDRHFIMAQALPGTLTGTWYDSLSLARIILPRMRSHRLIDLANAFGLPKSTHRADADVETTARLWRILMAGAYNMPAGLTDFITSLSPKTDWALRGIFTRAALSQPEDVRWSLRETRRSQTKGLKVPALAEEKETVTVFPTDEQITESFSAKGAAGRMYPSYEPRREQLDMALEVTAALRTGTHRSIEAGTGVGKSMAYLLPSALVAKANGTTVGVATKTNSLMDQLVYNELPRLDKALGGLNYIALKGYEHYPCLRKLDSMVRDTDRELQEPVIEMLATLLHFTAQSTWGDLDAINLYWAKLPRYSIEASSSDCLKTRCPFYPMRCYLHGARRQAASADIVVTNHALLFRDVQTDNGILPPIDYWVVDEAHAVENEARRQLSHTIAARDLESMALRLASKHGTLAQIRAKSLEVDGGVSLQGKCAQAQLMIETVRNVGASFFSFVKDLQALSNDHSAGYEHLTLWISPQTREEGAWLTLESPGKSLSTKLDDLVRCLTQLDSMMDDFEELSSQQADLANATCQLDEMREALDLTLDGTDKSYVYSANINRNPDKPHEELQASYLNVGHVLATSFFPNAKSVIFTSATLATGSKEPFAYFERGSGLSELPKDKHACRQMKSSYDFDANMRVLLPAGIPEPSSPDNRVALAELLLRVHTAAGGGVLTLFTNRKDMDALYRRLKPELNSQGIELIAQLRGISTKNLKDRFINEKDLCLFALRSFWEGFDAPGDTLRCVVIPRLPFGRPTDPISKERELREGRAAWGRYSLPEAVMDLKQAAGRLIRCSTDSGFLVLADARLQTKGYGRTFLNALPTNNIRTVDLDQMDRIIKDEL